MPEEEKIAALRELISSRGWKIVKEELESDIEITQKKLFGEIEMGEKETVEQLRRERIDRLELKEMPENMLKELLEDNPQMKDYNVYE